MRSSFKGAALASIVFVGAAVALAFADSRLTGSDQATGDNTGHDVDVNGDFLIAGSPGHDHLGFPTGAAYLFQRIAGNWSEIAELVPSDSALYDGVGSFDAVSTDGTFALLGGGGHDGGGADRGAVWVFSDPGSGWVETQKLQPASVVAGERFGWATDVDGQWAAVGAPHRSYGDVYVYQLSGGTWMPFQVLAPSISQYNSKFGYSVEIDGSRMIIGDYYGDSDKGAAYIFEFDGTTWNETAMLSVTDAGPSPRFGLSVSIDGDNAVVGAFRDPINGTRSGSAYAFAYDGTNWNQTAKLVPDDGAPEDSFGQEVAIDGNILVVGAHQHTGHPIAGRSMCTEHPAQTGS